MNTGLQRIRCAGRYGVPLLVGFSVLFFNSGCVYWRLNQFRNHLSAFPDHFRVEESDLPRIVALRPVLKPDDLGWLSGLAASETIESNGDKVERYHYRKQYMDAADDEAGAYDMLLSLYFNERGRAEVFEAPAQFASILTEENFDHVFGPMKDGMIERDRHATGWWWEQQRLNIPNREDIRFFFGVPSYTEPGETLSSYHYAYVLDGNEQRWNPTEWDAYTRFIFDPETEQVLFSETFKGRLHIVVDLRGERNLVQIERLSRSDIDE